MLKFDRICLTGNLLARLTFFAALVAVCTVMLTQRAPVASARSQIDSQDVITNTIAYSAVISATSLHTVRFVNGDGTNDRLITQGWFPRLSPDSRYVSFQRDGTYPTGTRDNVYVRDLAVLTETRVLTQGDYLVATNWSTDSLHLVADDACSIYRFNRDGTGIVDLTHARNCYDDAPAVKQNDGQLAFHNQFVGLLTADFDGQHVKVITNTKPGDWWPTWSHDGQWLSFLRGANYFKIRSDGTQLTQLTTLPYTITASSSYSALVPWSPAAWTSDDGAIVVPGTRNGVQGIYAMAADGGGATALVLAAPVDGWVDFVGSVTGTISIKHLVYLPVTLR